MIIDEPMRIAIIGDPHLNHKAPASRIDDYPEAILKKFTFIRNEMKKRNVRVAVVLGDVFNSPRQHTQYLNRVMEEFRKFRDDGMELYSIVGNHDIVGERIESLERTPLQTLFVSGIVGRLGNGGGIEFSDAIVRGFDYPEQIVKASGDSQRKMEICVAHRYFEFKFSDFSLTGNDLDELGYDGYIFGHDHEEYENVSGNGWTLYRCGSLSRGSANIHNMERIPCFSIISINEGRLSEERIRIDCESGSDVFSEVDADKAGSRKESVESAFTDAIERLGRLEPSENDVFSFLDAMEMGQEARETLEMYLNEGGFFRIGLSKKT